MKIYVCAILTLFLSQGVVAQPMAPMPWLISEAKDSVLPIVCRWGKTPHDTFSLGTAVLLAKPGKKGLALTCEHVVAIKDSLGRTVRYAQDIHLFMNLKDSSSTAIPVDLVYADKKHDFALLVTITKDLPQQVRNQLSIKYVQPSRWKGISDIEEGEPVIYIGYPMRKGIGQQNHPLSRTGIVSQLIPGNNFFLIDGFVQRGHSGSPVFLVRYESGDPSKWLVYLIGITTAFPAQYGDLYQEVRLEKVPGRKVLINPGFSNVISMEPIIPVLEDIYSLKK